MSVNPELINALQKAYELAATQVEPRGAGHARHSGVVMRLAGRLSTYAETHRLGGVYGCDVTFKVGPVTLAPDLAFVAASRMPPGGEPESCFVLAPDLAVEVLTATDSGEVIHQKMMDYFKAGTRQVWVVLLESRTVHLHRSASDFVVLTESDDLFNLEIVPGFRCRVAEIFRQPGD